MDATQTKAGGGGQPAFHSNDISKNVTPSAAVSQFDGDAAAVYAGAVLREARNIVERICKRQPRQRIKLSLQRLRAALDALDWVCDYNEHEARP
jgi:hypothetical protein